MLGMPAIFTPGSDLIKGTKGHRPKAMEPYVRCTKIAYLYTVLNYSLEKKLLRS